MQSGRVAYFVRRLFNSLRKLNKNITNDCQSLVSNKNIEFSVSKHLHRSRSNNYLFTRNVAQLKIFNSRNLFTRPVSYTKSDQPSELDGSKLSNIQEPHINKSHEPNIIPIQGSHTDIIEPNKRKVQDPNIINSLKPSITNFDDSNITNVDDLNVTKNDSIQNSLIGEPSNFLNINMSPMLNIDGPKFTNRLSKEKSPYLLQHAHNPVDWYPWGQEAFEKAKKENKLIFLSIGYSTCHWCHVMEKECFQDERIANLLNKSFVNIKVDREERPDIDTIYMTFVQATIGSGGWPMSVFITPELNAVSGGTYYPKEDMWGRPGLKSIITDLAAKWHKQSSEFVTSSAHIMEVLQQVAEMTIDKKNTPPLPSETCWQYGVEEYINAFDPEYGGFAVAPKFPQPSNLNFLFHVYARNKDSDTGKKCLEMCLHTLKKMAYGGIHDHICKGFSRYSIDKKWHLPHFEKMLYDQAQLAASYTDAYLATKEEFFSNITRDILTYVNRELSHEEGGFYSAEDADSLSEIGAREKKEGALYVWEYEEVSKLLEGLVLSADVTRLRIDIPFIDIICHHFNIKKTGNIDKTQDPNGEMFRKNVLIVLGSSMQTAQRFGISLETVNQIISQCKNIMYEVRMKRPRPHLDTKMICSWNGLMISAYAKAGQALSDDSYIERASKAASFVKKHLYKDNRGTLLRLCYRDIDGAITQIPNPIDGFVDDYAFLINGLLILYEATLDSEWLDWAGELQNKQDELFWDDVNYGYFTSSNRDSTVVLRLKEDVDSAEPSGNSVSVHNLLRLAAHGDCANEVEARRVRAQQILTCFSNRLIQTPTALPEMLSALMLHLDSPTQTHMKI